VGWGDKPVLVVFAHDAIKITSELLPVRYTRGLISVDGEEGIMKPLFVVLVAIGILGRIPAVATPY